MTAGPVVVVNVDDDHAGRYARSRHLKRAGYDVLEGATGAEALELARRKPALLVLDVRLPDMSGLDVCRRLREDPATAFLTILAISATFVKDEDRARALDAGADGYLTQPVDPIVLVATVRALLRMRKAEEEARAQARQWQATFDAIGDGIAVVDAEGRVQRSNPAFQRLVGGSLGGRPLREALEAVAPPGDLPLESVFGLSKRHTIAIVAGERALELTLDPIPAEAGAPGTCVCILSDVTPRHAAELEQRRALELQQAARQEAEHANTIKDEFLATLSHELRTPLAAMLGWSRVLRSGKADAATMARGLEVIDRNVDAQTQLIEDLLDVSRIISGKLVLASRTLDLRALVEECVQALRPSAEARHVLLQAVHLAPGRVSGDPDRLRQVINNLLGNALKFTPAGGHVGVIVEREEAFLEVKVLDSGRGIDPAFLAHVFDRFRQADSSPTRLHGGLGLGLAIVRHLVEQHGGTVRVESRGRDLGSTFTVRLPVVEQDEIAEPPAEPAAPARPADLTGVHVLVVEDEADHRELLELLLRRAGAEVLTVASVAEALEAHARRAPDVLVSDIGMPQEDGYRLIQILRERGVTTPALALTANAREQDRARALGAGFQLYEAKPVQPAALIAAVARLAARR